MAIEHQWFSASNIQCEMNAHGLLVIGPLPTCRLQLRVSAAQSWDNVEVAKSQESTGVIVRLHRD